MRVVTIQANSLSHFGLAHQQAIVMAVILWTGTIKSQAPFPGAHRVVLFLVTESPVQALLAHAYGQVDK